jgi:DNA-dependent protein kinase catalytic subunit
MSFNDLSYAATHINVRLFLAKVITKARKIFAPYSTHWIRPYMQTILIDPRKSGGLKFHYMLRDICITILQWNVTAAPDCSLSTKFIHHLINVAAHGSNQVLRANIDIIRLFLENWKGSISLERGSVLRYLIAGGKNPDMNDKNIKMQRAVGLQLLGAIVASGFPIYDSMYDSSVSEEYILEALMNNLNVKTKEVYEAAAELLGIAVKYRRQKSGDVDEELLERKLHRYLKQLYREAEYERFFNILGKVTTRDPYFLEGYAAMVVDELPRRFGTYKVIALDTLLKYPKADPNLFNQITRSLPKLLTHRDEIAQLKTLQLLSELLKDVTEDKISERVLPVLCDTFNRHESVNCKRVFYEILMYLFKSKNMDKERLVIHSLLMGLCDSSDTLRSSLQNFWHLQLSQVNNSIGLFAS